MKNGNFHCRNAISIFDDGDDSLEIFEFSIKNNYTIGKMSEMQNTVYTD